MNLKENPNFELAHVPELSTVVFRYKNSEAAHEPTHDDVNLYIKNKLYTSGKASVASTKLNGNIYLKFTLLNPKNTIENLLNIVKMIEETGKQYQPKTELL